MLTVNQIETAKPKNNPHRLLDSSGLYLYLPTFGEKCMVDTRQTGR